MNLISLLLPIFSLAAFDDVLPLVADRVGSLNYPQLRQVSRWARDSVDGLAESKLALICGKQTTSKLFRSISGDGFLSGPDLGSFDCVALIGKYCDKKSIIHVNYDDEIFEFWMILLVKRCPVYLHHKNRMLSYAVLKFLSIDEISDNLVGLKLFIDRGVDTGAIESNNFKRLKYLDLFVEKSDSNLLDKFNGKNIEYLSFFNFILSKFCDFSKYSLNFLQISIVNFLYCFKNQNFHPEVTELGLSLDLFTITKNA